MNEWMMHPGVENSGQFQPHHLASYVLDPTTTRTYTSGRGQHGGGVRRPLPESAPGGRRLNKSTGSSPHLELSLPPPER